MHTLTMPLTDSCLAHPADEPHKSEEDKLNRKPFCTDGSTCFYYAPVAGFNNGDQYAGNKGGRDNRNWAGPWSARALGQGFWWFYQRLGRHWESGHVARVRSIRQHVVL